MEEVYSEFEVFEQKIKVDKTENFRNVERY